MIMLKGKKNRFFHNNIFFKYSLLGDNEWFKVLRKGIIGAILEKQV